MSKLIFLPFFILLVSTILLTESCAPEKCEFVLCQNGGTCIDGECDCPDGYTGINCHFIDKLPFHYSCHQG